MTPNSNKSKISNLISLFESPPTTTSNSNSNDSTSLSTSPTASRSSSINSTSTNRIRTNGLVSSNIRKFSLNSIDLSNQIDATAGNQSKVLKGKEVNGNEIRQSLGSMDWSSRPRETGELRSEARVRLGITSPTSLSPTISATQVSTPSSTSSMPTFNTPNSLSTPNSKSSTPINSTTSTTYPPKSFITPTTSTIPSISKARAKAFKPGRLAPLPPSNPNSIGNTGKTSLVPSTSTSTAANPSGTKLAPTILIPATVSSSADGGKTKLSIVEKRVEKKVVETKKKVEQVEKEVEKVVEHREDITTPGTISDNISTSKTPFLDPISTPSKITTPTSIPTFSNSSPSSPSLPSKESSPFSDPLQSLSNKASLPATSLSPPPSYNDTLPLIRPKARPVQPPSSPSSPQYPNSNNQTLPQRPTLNHASSSQITSLTMKNLPASILFKSIGAEKLILPDLDEFLNSLIIPEFTNINSKGLMSDLERDAWDKWCIGLNERKVKNSWFNRLSFSNCFSSRKSKSLPLERGKYVDLEAVEKGRMMKTEATPSEIRSLIFPPMHLVPVELTVTDLKTNRVSLPLLGSFSSFLGIAVDGVLAGEGSSYGVEFETVESFRDLMQMFTLIIGSRITSTSTSNNGIISSTSPAWFHKLFIQVPKVLSLDLVSAFGMAVLWLWVFTIIAGISLYELWRFTGGWKGQVKELRDLGEGFDREGIYEEDGINCVGGKNSSGWRNSRKYKMFITFLVTSLYLPLSKISISALAWSSDYWQITNPYTNINMNSTSPTFNGDFPTNITALGPSSQYYDTMDFCYRTTMLKPSGFKNWNWSWAILPVAILTVCVLTIWLPYRLHQVITSAVPKVDPYTELGEKRKDTAAEYTRLLAVDQSPYSFLYQAYRRPWASFKSIYMLVKLVNILLVVLLTKDNCIFRSYTASSLTVIRQASLLGFMTLFLIADTFSKPFIDMISNNSDRVSRIGFVVLALLGLLVALNVPFKATLAGPITIAVDIISYGFNLYFSIIGTGFAMSWVKRRQFRLDFSIDIFSPHLDLAKHVSRRIWQETWSALLLAAPEFKMPLTEQLNFTDDSNLPPYLLGFKGTQGERHVENLKILRAIGLEAYSNAMKDKCLSDDCRIIQVRNTIRKYFVGPDIVWNPPPSQLPSKVTSFFGRLDVYPFPFVAVFRYDQDSTPIQITNVDDLELLIRQNESNEVRESVKVRMAIRSLENQEIFSPHTITSVVSKRGGITVERRVDYKIGKLTIVKNSNMCWRGYNYSSGFQVRLTYSDGQGEDEDGTFKYGQSLVLNSEDLGITSDFRLTSSLAKLLKNNREIIERKLPQVDNSLSLHREYFYNQAQWKTFTLSHSFLFDIVANDTLSTKELENVLQAEENDPKVQAITTTYPGTLLYLHERRNVVMQSRISQWWFLLFDDLWRSNRADISLIRNQPQAFSPHYRTSICYKPLSRDKLEEFLRTYSLFTEDGKKGFFNTGFLNRIYFYLNEIIFSYTSKAIPIHLGSSPRNLRFDDLEHIVPSRIQRLQPHLNTESIINPDQSYAFPASHSYGETGEGSGTDHDTNLIRPRESFTFESLFDEPKLKWERGNRRNYMKDLLTHRLGGNLKYWLGLTPFSHDHSRAHHNLGITLDLRRGSEGEGWKLPKSRATKEEKGDDIVF